jgi:hypothetical protein
VSDPVTYTAVLPVAEETAQFVSRLLAAERRRRRTRGRRRAARHAAGRPRRRALHVTVDGTLIRTDRCRAPGPPTRPDRPDRRVGLWWSGKHAAHGGNVQVIAAPDGWPLWTSDVRPGREHDTAALRADPEVLPRLAEQTNHTHAALAYLLHAAIRAPAARGNSLLKTTFKALRRVSLCPWRIGAITAAALVLLHHMHDRST